MSLIAHVPLWPGGAPGALGTSSADCPDLAVYHPALASSTASGTAAISARSCILICPGGGYQHKAAHEGEPVALWLNSLGLAAAVVQYRTSPYRYPIPANDARRALRMLRANAENWSLRPHQIGILGFSAGGHCAITTATIIEHGCPNAEDPIDRQSARPDALIACYPVVTFKEHGHLGSMRNLLADANGNVDPHMQEYLSLENRVNDNTPPTFIWHTADDQGVPVENSLMLATALKQQKVSMELHIFPHGKHGLGLAMQDESVGQWKKLCHQWLQKLNFSVN